MTAKRAHFPDEEPETEYLTYYYTTEGCSWCGDSDHTNKQCPDRPLSTWINEPKRSKK